MDVFNGFSLIQFNKLQVQKRNRLLNKGVSNIYLKVTIDSFSEVRFSLTDIVEF